MTTLGCHNLHDELGVPTFFADAIGYTEAITPTIRARKRARWAKAKGRLTGYTIRECSQQRDLVMALRRWHYRVDATRYVYVHGGVAKVTPHRGTFVVETTRRKGKRRRATGRREVFLIPHRINAAFPPFIRGEGKFRAAMWAKHEATDERLVAEYESRGFVVHVMGDLNTPHGVKGTSLPHEVGDHFDRLASTRPLTDLAVMSRMGSDHPRLKATVG